MEERDEHAKHRTLPWVVRSVTEAWRAIRPVTGFLLGWSLVQVMLLVPLLGWAATRLTARSGELAVTNYDITTFLLSPAGLAFLIGGGVFNLALVYAQHAGLFLIASRAHLGAVPSLLTVLWQNVRRIPGLARLALWQMLGFVLLLLPFVVVVATIALSLLGEHDINYYLAAEPSEWRWTVRLTVLLLGVYGILAGWLYLRWILAVPGLLLSGQGAVQCLKLSWRATRGRLRWVARPFAVWWALWLTVLFVVGTAFTVVAGFLVDLAGTSLPRLIPVLIVIESVAFVGGLLGAYVGGVVHQFLLAQLYWDFHPRTRLPEIAPTDSPAILAGLKPVVGFVGAVLLLVSGVGTWRYISSITPEISVEITAHRGSSRRAPENTLSALRQALAEHADYAEIDVQSTKDGRVVLMHDGDLMRVAGDPRRVKDLTLDELRKVDIGSWFSEEFKGERITTLKEAIELVRGQLKLNIELKYNGPDPALSGRVLQILREQDFVSDCVITSLTADELVRLGREAPELRVGLIVTAVLGDTTRLPVQFLSMNAAQVSHTSVSLAHRQGKAVHVWTVNDRASALRMIEMGVDNLITDEPEMMVTLRKELRELSQAELIALALRTRLHL